MAEVLRWLREGAPAAKALVLVAHPDDEVLGAGARLPRLRGAAFLHVTDGAPRDLRDARAAGCAAREEYARVRRDELLAALALAGIGPGQAGTLGVVDQEASLQLAELTRRVADVLAELRPAFVLTHPYEGGHPDHDATAFAAHAACRLLEGQGVAPPALVEMASYHGAPGFLVPGDFLPDAVAQAVTLTLTEPERAFKRRLLDCYRSQRDTLQYFPVEVERFRLAPRYDFTRPPHQGRLWYERFDWGITGPRWRELAAEALEALGIGERVWV